MAFESPRSAVLSECRAMLNPTAPPPQLPVRDLMVIRELLNTQLWRGKTGLSISNIMYQVYIQNIKNVTLKRYARVISLYTSIFQNKKHMHKKEE